MEYKHFNRDNLCKQEKHTHLLSNAHPYLNEYLRDLYIIKAHLTHEKELHEYLVEQEKHTHLLSHVYSNSAKNLPLNKKSSVFLCIRPPNISLNTSFNPMNTPLGIGG